MFIRTGQDLLNWFKIIKYVQIFTYITIILLLNIYKIYQVFARLLIMLHDTQICHTASTDGMH